MFTLGPMEIAFFLGIVLLLFGPDKIPQIAKSVGKATKEYQRALKEVTDSGDSLMSEVKGGSTGLTETKTSAQEPKVVNREQAIMEQAQLLGISTNGKTIDQIVDEILSRN
jgi:TatA/E family protein of Tat protein translocase